MQPPASQAQVQQAMQAQMPVKAQPPSPLSPSALAREKERVSTILEINTLLLKETLALFDQGKGGAIGQQPPQDGKPEAERQKPSPEYDE
jgi:hypothetical protein